WDIPRFNELGTATRIGRSITFADTDEACTHCSEKFAIGAKIPEKLAIWRSQAIMTGRRWRKSKRALRNSPTNQPALGLKRPYSRVTPCRNQAGVWAPR